MFVGRKRSFSSSSFGPNGKRNKPDSSIPTVVTSSKKTAASSCKVFKPKANISFAAQKAPLNNDVSVTKKFQRPMTKRRAYNQRAEQALKISSLGSRKRMDGMSKLMARAGRGLSFKLPSKPSGDGTDSDSDTDNEKESKKEDERPFEPLMVWQSPHQGGVAIGLPPRLVQEKEEDEFGIEELVTVKRPAPLELYSRQNVFIPPILAKWLRPHQRAGVHFLYQCVMGLRGKGINGCILADDMGLGKTLQSVTLIYSLLKTGITANREPTAKRIIVVCPCSLVKNWDNEFTKWLGAGGVKTIALAESDRKTVEKNLDVFCRTKMFNILISSYETIRTHVGRLVKYKDCCDLLVCDEAHRLKNNENQTSRALASLPVKRRVLLTGTPMQNDLSEFFAMVDFTNPGILGTQEDFNRRIKGAIYRGREPDATDAEKAKMQRIQNEMSTTVNDFILRRVNTLNAQHLPPKLVQVVCCNLTQIQQNMYQHLVSNKDMQHVLKGKQANCLGYIQMLMKLCNHPRLIVEEESTGSNRVGRRAAAQKSCRYNDDEKESSQIAGIQDLAKFLPYLPSGQVLPEWSGKMFVLYRLMKEMRRPGNGGDKIVIVSNYTQTLDLIGKMCRENSWGFCRLDGSIAMKKRQKMVEEFNDPSSSLIAFLLSSKAGGCGLNLIGGNRLVLFDPDWNPAVDKQAAARCWRDGQKKRCFTYRFLATGTVEEKIFQRQLSKEGLQSVVDDKEQVNILSTKDLRNLFKFRSGTPSDTHDKLRCERCKIIADNAELEAKKILPKQLVECEKLLNRMMQHADAKHFLQPMVSTDYGISKEEYEKLVKQPMDLGTIKTRVRMDLDSAQAFHGVSGFSKDVNRVFTNALKVWSPGQDVADAASRLQTWWVSEWTHIVPVLMSAKFGGSEKPSDSLCNHDDSSAIVASSNERGEDFQDQIGMPEEEDMRSWSHHYTTDTVDDPIFRAAMRGFDSVSFVFGLEVTWSLIQQRKHEEEERRAMEELEAMKEMESMETVEGDNTVEGDTQEEAVAQSGDDACDSTLQSQDENCETSKAEKVDPQNDTESESKTEVDNQSDSCPDEGNDTQQS